MDACATSSTESICVTISSNKSAAEEYCSETEKQGLLRNELKCFYLIPLLIVLVGGIYCDDVHSFVCVYLLEFFK